MIHIKSVITTLLLVVGTSIGFSQSKNFACYYDRYWGDWRSFSAQMQGSYNGFVLFLPEEHPSNFFFSFQIENRTPPTKKEVKEHLKKTIMWEYQGTVEYYVCDVYPTIKDCFKQFKRPLMKSDLETTDYSEKLSVLRATRIRQQGDFVTKGLTKRTARAIIKIAPYSHKTLKPMVYNIWFDGVGFAIDLDDCYFKNSY